MELLRLGPIGHEIPVVRDDGVCFDLRPLITDIDPNFSPPAASHESGLRSKPTNSQNSTERLKCASVRR